VLKKIVAIVVIAILILLPLSASASPVAVVTIVGVPGSAGGISNFTITYTSDTQLDLAWTLYGDAVNIMIRGKYKSYPADIPDQNTTPSDGYLVYYGSASAVSDTSMDFSQNVGPIYYKAWAQKADGTWYTAPLKGSKESRDVILATLFGVLAIGAIGFTITGYVKHQPILALFGAAFFLMMGGFAVSQTVTQWDVWYDLMFVSFIFGGLVAMVAFSLDRTERAARRTKAAAEKAEKTRPRTTQEQWAMSQQEADDIYQSTHLPRARRKSRS